MPDALPKNDGVDWKSLTTPALLPITTDFFPDLESLRKDYNFNEFCYSPQEINSATGSKFGLNCAEAFAELVSQRFAHGFQLIIFPEGTQPPGGKDIRSKGQGKKAGGGRTTKNCKDLDRLFNIESGRNLYHHWLSIGRIYHKITYNQEIQEILVNKNQPLQPLADEKQDYRYRFQVGKKKNCLNPAQKLRNASLYP